jgi:hypothetical protein
VYFGLLSFLHLWADSTISFGSFLTSISSNTSWFLSGSHDILLYTGYCVWESQNLTSIIFNRESLLFPVLADRTWGRPPQSNEELSYNSIPRHLQFRHGLSLGSNASRTKLELCLCQGLHSGGTLSPNPSKSAGSSWVF